MNIKSVALFNRNRPDARPSPSVHSNTIPTLPKPTQLKTESIENFLRRSGKITHCQPAQAPKQKQSVAPTRGQMLSFVRSNPPQTTSALKIVRLRGDELLVKIHSSRGDVEFGSAA